MRAAVLKLNRERLLDCHGGTCDRRKQQQQNQKADQSSNRSNDEESNIATGHHIPFYQKLYILSVNGYDEHKTPITSIIGTLRLDTRYSTPITFDISKYVKMWLSYPEKNYGIIVRVYNDDPEYDKMKQSKQSSNASSTTTEDDRDAVLEHVRLKRGFRSTSDSEDSWLRQEPLLTLYLGPPDSSVTRNNVKRADNPDLDNMEGVQADAPDLSSDASSLDETTTTQSATNKPNARSSTSGKQREGRQMTTEARPQSLNGRTISSSRSTATQRPRSNKQQKQQKVEKCHVHTMTINFDEVGWSNWIIAPSSFSANYCMGDCSFPLADHQNSTNHAIIQAIFHSVGRNIPRTCCAPTKLGRMAILHQLDHAVQMKYYDDMLVEECGCL